MENRNERVSHPKHYQRLKDKFGIEVWDIAEEYGFVVGNAIKYLMRAGDKPEEGMTKAEKEIEDYLKAIEYIRKKISNVLSELPQGWCDKNKESLTALTDKLRGYGVSIPKGLFKSETSKTMDLMDTILSDFNYVSTASEGSRMSLRPDSEAPKG